MIFVFLLIDFINHDYMSNMINMEMGLIRVILVQDEEWLVQDK